MKRDGNNALPILRRFLVIILFVSAVSLLVYQAFLLLLLSTFGIGGSGDWSYKHLPNGYEIWRCSKDNIILVKSDDPNFGDIVVDKCVISFTYNERYIGLQQVLDWDGEGSFSKEKINYYLIDAETEKVIGPLSKAEYSQLCDHLSVVFENEIVTSSKPKDADD